MPYKAINIAKLLVNLTKRDEGDSMTNLRLQRLLYFCQGYYLALYDKPLFEEDIKTATHGPLVPDVFQYYKDKVGTSDENIPRDENFDPHNHIEEEDIEFLDEIYLALEEHSSIALMNICFNDGARSPIGQNEKEMDKEDLKDYFIKHRTQDEQEQQDEEE